MDTFGSITRLVGALVAMGGFGALGFAAVHPPPRPGQPDIATLVARPVFKAAVAALAADDERVTTENIRLTEIPAPPYKESDRARVYEQMMRDNGLQDVGTDGIGNVIGVRPGADRKLPVLVVSAHLDTVFPEGTNVKVRRDGTKLFAPGIGDDTRGLAVLLAFVRAMDKAHLRTPRDIVFVGDVGEEGQGDLRGIRYLFAKDPRARTAAAYITVDSTGSQNITTVGVGSKRYRLTFSGPGGHSYGAFGLVNPLVALAKVVEGLYSVQVPGSPKTTYSASVVGGGTSVNAIPAEVFLEVDLRSADAGELAKLDTRFHDIVSKAVALENATRDTKHGKVSVDVKSIGERPAGHTDDNSPLVIAAADAARGFGYTPKLIAVSSDANIPMSLGIPAIGIGSGASGGREHAPDEYIDVAKSDNVRGMSVGLATVVAAAGGLAR
jgi:tripeptide aminopeptidase